MIKCLGAKHPTSPPPPGKLRLRWPLAVQLTLLRCNVEGDLCDDAGATQFLVTSEQDETGEDVRRHHVQVTEELGEQLGDLGERVLHRPDDGRSYCSFDGRLFF